MKSVTNDWPDIIVDSPSEAVAEVRSRKRSGWRMVYLLPLAALLGLLLLPLALALAVLDGLLWQCDCSACSDPEGAKMGGGR